MMVFWKFLCPIWFSKYDCCGRRWTFFWYFQENFQKTLLLPIHAVARVNQTEIRNEGFDRYLKNPQKINSEYKGSLHQWVQGLFSALYACNVGPVDGTEMALSVLDIGRGFHFQLNYYHQYQGRAVQKDSQTCITLRQDPHLYLDK